MSPSPHHCATHLALAAANLAFAVVVVWLAPAPDVLVLCLVVLLGFAGTWLRAALANAPAVDLSAPDAPGAPRRAAGPAAAGGRGDDAGR